MEGIKMDKTLDQLAHDPTSSRFVKDIVELAQGRDLSDVANDLHVLAIAADNQCKQNYEIYLGVTKHRPCRCWQMEITPKRRD